MKSFVHSLTDTTLATFLQRGRLYSDGFGDRRRMARLVEGVRDVPASEPSPADVIWEKPRDVLGLRVLRGSFRSPLADELPPESERVQLELIRPAREPDAPLAVLLAATAEEGFARRRVFAAPLLRKGVGVVMVENPYYGTRRPRGQRGANLASVADQFAMNLATVLEVRALLAHLRSHHGSKVVVTGFSQGAMMAAFAAVTVPFAVGVVPFAAGVGARPIFLDGVLSRVFDWGALARDEGGLAQEKEVFARALEPVSLAAHGPPVRPDLAVILGAAHDAFVPRAEVESLHAHWPGSELRWVGAGHVTGAVLHQGAHRRAILDVFSRM